MKIHKYVCDSDTYHSLLLSNDEEYLTVLNNFTGSRLEDIYVPLDVELYKTKSLGNFPQLVSHVPVFDEVAAKVMTELIGGVVELLPATCRNCDDENSYSLVNVCDVLDCLDVERSDITYFDDGEIMFVDKYAFTPGLPGGRHIFKIKGLELKYVFVSEVFKKLVEEKKLRGLIFEEVGSD